MRLDAAAPRFRLSDPDGGEAPVPALHGNVLGRVDEGRQAARRRLGLPLLVHATLHRETPLRVQEPPGETHVGVCQGSLETTRQK